jgi:hypothetical protein
MTDRDIELLRQYDQRLVRFHMKDGEVAVAKVLFVSDSDADVVVDLASSNKAELYPKYDVQPTFQFRFQDIESVEPA